MVRFVVCRKEDKHVIAARDGDMIVLQRIAPQVGMVQAVLGVSTPADVEPLTGVASRLGQSTAGEDSRVCLHRLTQCLPTNAVAGSFGA